jgi:SPP1 family predicted phage head-tail adaptor
MPWKPKCCASSLSSIIDDLTFDKRITFQCRSQTQSFAVNDNTAWAMTDIVTVWAAVSTKTSQNFFDGVNRSFSTSHIFTIRYSASIDTQLEGLTEKYWILYNNKRYNILATENINEEDILLRFTANVRGKDDVELNKS